MMEKSQAMISVAIFHPIIPDTPLSMKNIFPTMITSVNLTLVYM